MRQQAAALALGVMALAPTGAHAATPAQVDRPNPCVLVVRDPTGDNGALPERDTDITQVTYRLGPHDLTAIIQVPGLANHAAPAVWNQRASFWDVVGWDSGETYPWQYATARRGTLPDPETNPPAFLHPHATWDDLHGIVTLRLSRNDAETVVETNRGAIAAVQLDIQIAADSEQDEIGTSSDSVHMPLLRAEPCDVWRRHQHH